MKARLAGANEADQQWRLYVLMAGKFYYAIILNASGESMTLNGGFYENIVRTYRGVRE